MYNDRMQAEKLFTIITIIWQGYSGDIESGRIYEKIHQPRECRIGIQSVLDSRGHYRNGLAEICDDEDWILRIRGYNTRTNRYELRDELVNSAEFSNVSERDYWVCGRHPLWNTDKQETRFLSHAEIDSLLKAAKTDSTKNRK